MNTESKNNQSVNNEEPKVYLSEGRRFVILSKLAEALGVSKPDVYNASARMGGDAPKLYVKIIKLQDMTLSRNVAKCIDVEGIPFLFKKLAKKVEYSKLEEVANYLNVNLDEVYEKKANIVKLNIPNIELENQAENNSQRAEIETIDKIGSENIIKPIVETSVELNKENTAEENIEASKTMDVEAKSSTDEAENIMDGILSIIQENRNLKEKVASLENEVAKLKDEASKFNANPEELEALRQENMSLKEKLKASEEKSLSLVSKANLIKQYIQDNR